MVPLNCSSTCGIANLSPGPRSCGMYSHLVIPQCPIDPQWTGAESGTSPSDLPPRCPVWSSTGAGKAQDGGPQRRRHSKQENQLATMEQQPTCGESPLNGDRAVALPAASKPKEERQVEHESKHPAEGIQEQNDHESETVGCWVHGFASSLFDRRRHPLFSRSMLPCCATAERAGFQTSAMTRQSSRLALRQADYDVG
jgi:hypothetical protein